ncbi:MAG: hypothetical protein IJH52_07375 [Oscillospiraceae bacterium]|nr:hypothetical protein [Oscillospiraceae bacterium]
MMENLLSPEAPWVYIVLCIGAVLVQSLCVRLVRDTLRSLMAPESYRSQRRRLYQAQPLREKISLRYLKPHIVTLRRLYPRFYALYVFEAAFLFLGVIALAVLPFRIGCAMLPPAVVTAKAIISLLFLRVFVYRQGFTGAPKYEYMMRGK